jgi:hypothetical protein
VPASPGLDAARRCCGSLLRTLERICYEDDGCLGSVKEFLKGALDMTSAEEQQMLKSLSEIARDMNALLTLVRELTLQQDKADQKAFQALTQIAHKR